MTIDETPRGPGSGGESRRMGRSRTTARDLERYAGLFARRTQGMKSSAMRDLMAITARPEVISLAGGLPDTSTFPAEDLAALMARVAADASARALQYGPTEGMDELKACIVRVMAEEGMDVGEDELLVTTGGQQVIDLVCKTLIDPGDVIVAEGPTYPGAVPTFGAYEADVVQIEMDADGMRVDLLEETLDRLEHEGRTPKFIYTVPTFQNPAGVTMALDRRRRLVRIAAEREILVLEDNPYGLLRYEGDPLPPLYALDRGEYVIYLGTFSKILSPGLRLGWTAAPRPVLEKLNLGKQGADLCSSTFGQHFVVEYFGQRDWRALLGRLRELYRRRRDTMLEALAEHFPREAEWTRPRGGLFIWATLPDYIDTTDLLARALREHVAFVPGRAAYLDGRGGSAMRLNFSGVGDDDIHEGIARIGKVINEQVRLYSTLTGVDPAPPRAGSPGRRRRETRRPPRTMRRRTRAGASSRCAGGPDEPRRGAGGRPVARAPGVAAVGRTRPRRAGEARPRRDRDRRRSRPGRPAAGDAPRRRVRRAARARRRGRHRAGDPRARRRAVHRVGAVGVHALHGQGGREARAARRRTADAGLLRVQPDRVRVARRGACAAGDRGSSRLPGRGQARVPGLRAGDPLRTDAPPTFRPRSSPRSRTTRR